MNFNNFTIKAQEAVQEAVNLVQGRGQQAIEPVHVLQSVMKVGENVTNFIFQKLGMNGQQIALDVAHGRGIGFQAVHDVLDVHAVDLEQPFLDQRSRKIVPGNRQSRTRRAERFHHEIDDFVQLLQIGRVVLRNLEIVDVPFHLIPVLSDPIFLHPSSRLCRQRGGGDG